MGLLDLSNADLSGFEPLEPGRYNAEIFEIKWDTIKNADGQGKMPAGTPLLKVQFRLTDEGVENRRVFSQYVNPPKDYDKEKAAKMKGMIARFFIALGIDEDVVKSKDFDPDFDDLKGTPCVVQVKKEQKRTRQGDPIEGEWNNPVSAVRAAGSLEGASAGSGLL